MKMKNRSVYDTRFFFDYFYSPDKAATQALKASLQKINEKIVSAITIHELHRLNLKKLDKESAKLRSTFIRNEFKVFPIDYETAVAGAELCNKYRIPLADSIIAATALREGCPVVSDDPHFKSIPSLKTTWPLP
jgi:predicted nucleic acid-binding protein